MPFFDAYAHHKNVLIKNQQVREVPENWGPVSLSSCGSWVGSRLVVRRNTTRWDPPPLYAPPPLLVTTARKEGCSEAGKSGVRSRGALDWWPLESGNTTRPDPTLPGTSRTC